MPAHRATRSTAALDADTPRPPVPAVGVLLTLFMVIAVCLLALGAANSSIEPGDGWSATTPVTAQASGAGR